MKKYIFSALVVLCVFLFAGCECEHNWVDANCISPKTCSLCGETEGEIVSVHAWKDATCSSPRTCVYCGVTEGTALTTHSWEEATCSSPKTCSQCGATEGSTIKHVWQSATCVAPKTCMKCGQIDGDLGDHRWQKATCSAPKTCAVCGETTGEIGDHEYTKQIPTAEYLCAAATVESPAKYYYACEHCGEMGKLFVYTYGDSIESKWAWNYYVDYKFGDLTDEWYVTPRDYIKGTFSNSATTNSDLLVEILYDCNNDIAIFLYEYGDLDNQVKNNSSKYSDSYEVTIKNNAGKTIEVTGKIYAGGDRLFLSNVSQVLSMMKSSTVMRFFIQEEDSPTTQYRFDVDLTDFNYILTVVE